MIAVGENADAIVLVFETAKAKQCLSDDEASALHAQLGLMIQTRARRKGPVPSAMLPPAPGDVTFFPGNRSTVVDVGTASPPPVRSGPVPATKRRPMIEDKAEPKPVTELLLESGGGDALSAMDEAQRRDQEQIAAARVARINKKRAEAGLAPLTEAEAAAL